MKPIKMTRKKRRQVRDRLETVSRHIGWSPNMTLRTKDRARVRGQTVGIQRASKTSRITRIVLRTGKSTIAIPVTRIANVNPLRARHILRHAETSYA